MRFVDKGIEGLFQAVVVKYLLDLAGYDHPHEGGIVDLGEGHHRTRELISIQFVGQIDPLCELDGGKGIARLHRVETLDVGARRALLSVVSVVGEDEYEGIHLTEACLLHGLTTLEQFLGLIHIERVGIECLPHSREDHNHEKEGDDDLSRPHDASRGLSDRGEKVSVPRGFEGAGKDDEKGGHQEEDGEETQHDAFREGDADLHPDIQLHQDQRAHPRKGRE